MRRRHWPHYERGILDKYTVKLMQKAYQDLDEIYIYIAAHIEVRETAENLIDELERAILSLDVLPYRGAERKVGVYANKGYRQAFVKNFVIVYRVVERDKEVLIVTVKYTPSHF